MKANASVAAVDPQAAVARNVHQAIDHAASSAHSAIDKAVSAVDCASSWLNERGGQVKAVPTELVTKSTDYVAANPLRALAIALVAGIVLSKLVR